MITIIDFGMGNLRSVQKAFERLGASVEITTSREDIAAAQKLILPGVGHFAQGMQALTQKGLDKTIRHAVNDNQVPVLGICLGMQLLTNYSEEGDVLGLGLVDAKTRKFKNFAGLKIPHMGWNRLFPKKQSKLLDGISMEEYFYFVHSYFVTCEDSKDVLAQTKYGNNIVSAFQHKNIYGCQFHPEKSHDAGLKILKNFAEL